MAQVNLTLLHLITVSKKDSHQCAHPIALKKPLSKKQMIQII